MVSRTTMVVVGLVLALAAPVGAADLVNPVDLYGADGISLTPDDPLMVRGGFTNTSLTVCGAIESPSGDSSSGDYDHDVRLISWNPDTRKVFTYELFEGSGEWVEDPDAGKPTEPNGTGDEEAGIFHVWQPPKPYTKKFDENPDEDISFWNDGNNVMISSLHFQSWESSGTETENNPAISICPDHLKGPATAFLKDIRVVQGRLDGIVLSILNMETMSSGITGRVFCRLKEAGVKAILVGWLNGSDKVVIFGIEFWGKNKALDVVKKAWSKAKKPCPQEVLSYVSRVWDAGNGQDGVFTGSFWAFLPCNEWSVWKNTDAFALRNNPQIDIKVDVLQDPVGADDIIPKDGYPINGGLSFQNSELLIYGRSKNIPLARLIEHFAASWLNLNLHLLNPYTGPSRDNSTMRPAEWRYYDLITERNLTPVKGIPVPWPPPGMWDGGRGKVMGVQGGLGHQEDAVGVDRQPCQEPGNPAKVLSALIALSPDAQQPGEDRILAYNFFGIQLNGTDGPPLEANWHPDPVGEQNWWVPWPPPNETDTTVKNFYANVSNGGDKNVVADGEFVTGWDFDCDGQGETRFANTTWNVEQQGRSSRSILYVYNPATGRCGCQRVDMAPPTEVDTTAPPPDTGGSTTGGTIDTGLDDSDYNINAVIENVNNSLGNNSNINDVINSINGGEPPPG